MWISTRPVGFSPARVNSWCERETYPLPRSAERVGRRPAAVSSRRLGPHALLGAGAKMPLEDALVPLLEPRHRLAIDALAGRVAESAFVRRCEVASALVVSLPNAPRRPADR